MKNMERADSGQMVAAMVAAFPSYIRERLDRLGVVAGGAVEKATAAAAADLDRGLSELLVQPAAEQANSPLELVRSATKPITEALTALGLRPPARDQWLVDQYSEDVFDLYPASSQDLGEGVWRLHLEWGKAKARAVAGVVPAAAISPAVPTVALFGIPLDERDEVVAAVTACGYDAVVWRNPAALEQAATQHPVLALVDLRHPSAHDAIRDLAAAGTQVVATGPEVDDLNTPGLMALGAAEVVDSARLVSRIDRLLPRLA